MKKFYIQLTHKNYFFNYRSFWPHTLRKGIHEVSIGLVIYSEIRYNETW